MTAELGARRTAAAAVLADFRRWDRGEIITGDWQEWSFRLASELRSLLDQLGHEKPDPAASQLAQIRLVLDSFDWKTDDRQYALEQVEEIVKGRDQ
jgi:hypothetical protein